MAAKVLMVQGTGSHVGKSLLTAALCRMFTQAGYRVLPFKAQNMSNNAFVTRDGAEISRAQAEQARACRAEPSALMNPILLKPTTDIGAQVVVMGRTRGTMTAAAYEAFKPELRAVISGALRELQEQADILIIEGAGSPAEINLKAGDLVNMWVAQQTHAAVLLVGDIDRGGVFAQLIGTMELLESEERALVRGFLINKFRGDFSLLAPGIDWLERRCRLPVVGTIPYLHDVELAEEDAVPQRESRAVPDRHLTIEVVRVPRISNFTDFDALAREDDVRLTYVDRPSSDTLPDCVILPGSKSTIADLHFVRARGFAPYLRRCVEAGGEVVGICGGFQMLGQRIDDPDHLEAQDSSAEGLGWLPGVSVFQPEKLVAQVRGIHGESGLPVTGYEVHMGRMRPLEPASAVVRVTERNGAAVAVEDGLAVSDGRVWGTHVHGLFDEPGFRAWWLNRLRARRGLSPRPPVAAAGDVYDRLAAAVRPHLQWPVLRDMLGLV